ncbi:MAG: 4Fe-4S binding protein [Lachnospiraceae bacterium]|nr:4Fe-4S binding protein [Lachnospiraceae bacterium]
MATLTIRPEDEKRVKGLGFLSNKGTDNFSGRVITVNGKLTAEQQKVIAEAAELYGNGIITLTTRLTMEVQGIPYDKIEEFRNYIARVGLETGGTGAKVRPVVSCKGTTCQYGLIDTFALSEEIHERFFLGYASVKTPHKFKIAVGGCPNNCVKPDLNDIGIVGQRIPAFDTDACKGCKKCAIQTACPMGAPAMVDEKIQIDKSICNNCGRCAEKCPFKAMTAGQVGYKIYIGGRWGKKTSLGTALHKIFLTKEEALDVIEKALLFYYEQGLAGERFATTIERIGFQQVETQLLADDLLIRKKEILSK